MNRNKEEGWLGKGKKHVQLWGLGEELRKMGRWADGREHTDVLKA